MGIPTAPLDKQYKGRPGRAMPVNLSLRREAVAVLRQYATDNPKGRGDLVSDLLMNYATCKVIFSVLNTDVRKELQKIARQVRKDMRREGDA